MVSTATGSDLDNLLLLFGVKRLTITPVSDTPPVEAVMEADDNYRRRGLLVLEPFSTAGPKLGYEYHGLGVVGVHDIVVSGTSTSNGVVDIKVMSATSQASETLLDKVRGALNDEKIRPMATQLIVESATAVDYQIQATLALNNTPESALSLGAAIKAVDEYVALRFKIGKNTHLSGIYTALQQPGVEGIELILPASNVSVNNTQFANNTAISIS